MFEQSMVDRRSPRRPYTMAISLLLQLGLVALAVVAPLVFIDGLPAAQLSALFVLPALPIARAAAPEAPAEASLQRVKVKRTPTNVFTAPSGIPKKVAEIVEEIDVDPHLAQLAMYLPFDAGVRTTGGSGVPGLENLLTGSREAAAPPPPEPTKPKPAIQRVKRGGAVVEAMLVSRPNPVYPPLAIRARVQGDVHLNAIIGVDGTIKELRVQSGHPLLVNAALAAVSQWRYRPTTLNGDPVEVITQITVTFRIK